MILKFVKWMLRLYKLLIRIKLFIKGKIFLKFKRILNRYIHFLEKIVFFLFGEKVYQKLKLFYNNIINFYKLKRFLKKKIRIKA